MHQRKARVRARKRKTTQRFSIEWFTHRLAEALISAAVAHVLEFVCIFSWQTDYAQTVSMHLI